MKLITATVRAIVPVLAVVGIGLATASSPATAAGPRCVAQVIVHEDNSYSGTALLVDGRIVADRWIVTSPRFQGQTWWSHRGTPGVGGSAEITANVGWSGDPTFRGLVCSIHRVRS